MTTTINASPTNGLVQTADGSGVLKVQSNGVTTNALAWVNFNGSGGAIRTAYNVSSITVNSTADYTVNFTTALTNANYSIVATAGDPTWEPANGAAAPAITAYSTTSARFFVARSTGSQFNLSYINVAVFGN